MAGQFTHSSQAQFFHDHAFCKEPGTQLATPWHQDLPYYCVAGQQTVSIYVSLDHAREDAAVRFVRGSHRWSRLYHPRAFTDGDRLGESAQATEAVPDIEAHPEQYDIAAWALEPGDAVLFSFRTLHGTTSAQLEARRRAFSTRWLGDDVRYCDRGETSPPYPDTGLESGARMREDWFPVLLRVNAALTRKSSRYSKNDRVVNLVLRTAIDCKPSGAGRTCASYRFIFFFKSLGRLEYDYPAFGYADGFAGTGISPLTGRAGLDRKCSESVNSHQASLGE